MFLQKKRYQIQHKDGKLDIHGLRNSYKSKYQLEKYRTNKIQMILHKIREKDNQNITN